MIKIQIKKNQEVLETLNAFCKKKKIKEGAIVSLIGAVDRCQIHNMERHDATQAVVNEYDEPFEISGTGEIHEGKAHIHCVLGREGDETLSGHLHWAKVETWFVNAYIVPL